MIELRHLRYAVAVADENHITRAAERLGIQQPPLSQQIRALEREIGVTLFRRLPRGVEPTAAGSAFVERAKILLRDLEETIDTAKRAGRGEEGQLAVGFTASAAFHPLVSNVIRELRKKAPALRLSRQEANSGELIEAVRTGSLDAAFVRLPAREDGGLRNTRLLDEEMVVAMPKRHPLLKTWPLSRRKPLSTLAHEDFILYHRPNGPGLYDAIIAACDRAGFSPRIEQEASQMIATLSLVSAGFGISLIPDAMARLATEGVAYRHLTKSEAPTAPLVLVWRSGGDSGPLGRLIGDVNRAQAQYLASSKKSGDQPSS
ncbi:MAG: LysR family transcriptional regulator [Sphingomonas sp.]|uniref:LysR family transcriptional regulator n=1 Tax=Sphingomonas sp. TaxID=28214 RepID=UPI002617B49D|nr:LysR family transcriptional regulator [Sphingomonas sp.]MDK2770249.1 LysR family transcriptional regulator [Sphingomonas sp.]